jgi:beta-glucanase (GH16 family)
MNGHIVHFKKALLTIFILVQGVCSAMSGEISTPYNAVEMLQINRSPLQGSDQKDITDSSPAIPVDRLERGSGQGTLPRRPQFTSATSQLSETVDKSSKGEWKLVWSDEFNGPNGSAPDPARWTYDVGGHGFGNHELEYYTNRPENVVIQDGNLVITARKETYTGQDGVTRDYTSARLLTDKLFSHQNGRIESRIKIPEGKGMWPACWMLGENIGQVGWPECGEIDIMENVGFEPSSVHGTVHGPGYSGEHGIGATFKLPEGKKFSDDYHVFTVDWEPDSIRFSVDNQVYHTVTRASLPEGAPWVYEHPFFLLLNLAVGGDWPGPPDESTKFPQEMKVDWIRVYEKQAGDTCSTMDDASTRPYPSSTTIISGSRNAI